MSELREPTSDSVGVGCTNTEEYSVRKDRYKTIRPDTPPRRIAALMVGGLYLLAAGMVVSAWWTMQAFSIPILAFLIMCSALFRVALSAQRALTSDIPAATPSGHGRTAWLRKYNLAELRRKPISTTTAMIGTYLGVTALPAGLLQHQASGAVSTIVIQLFIAALTIPLYAAASTALENG